MTATAVSAVPYHLSGMAAAGNNAPQGFDARIFTYGHRNPQGICFRPGTNQPYTAENGPWHSDEVTALGVEYLNLAIGPENGPVTLNVPPQDIITRDKFSRVHLVAAGNVAGDAAAILTSPRLIITLEALAQAYDHVVIDGGALAEAVPEFFARMAPCAVLVATDIDNTATKAARDQLVAAGFAGVVLWLGTPSQSASPQPAAA